MPAQKPDPVSFLKLTPDVIERLERSAAASERTAAAAERIATSLEKIAEAIRGPVFGKGA